MRKSVSIQHVLKYTAVFGSVQVLTILMSIIRGKLTARLIGPVGVGVLNIYNKEATLVASTTNMGLAFSAVRNLSEIESTMRARHYIMVVRTWALWTGMFGALCCIVFAPLLARWCGDGKSDYTLGIMALAPMVCALAVSGGEMSILKGMKRLKRVASISAVGAVTTLLSTVPLYWLFGLEGVVMALVCSTVIHTVVHLCFTVGQFPYRVKIASRQMWREGLPMIRLGIPYILAGVAGSLAALAIPLFLNSQVGEDMVGFYSIGYSLMVTYAGMVFVAVESDYFPRLSAVNHDSASCNAVVNQQVRVCVMLMGPFLIAFSALMPLAVRILYTADFMPVVGMGVASVFYMLMRCVSVPVAYLALAKGCSKTYLLMELVYDVVSVAIIMLGFMLDGLEGTGWALSACGLFDALLVGLTYRHLYGFRLEARAWRGLLVHGVLLACAVAVCLCAGFGALRYLLCALLFAVAVAVSYSDYRKRG